MSCVALCLSCTLEVVCSRCSAEITFVFSPDSTHAVECVWPGVARLLTGQDELFSDCAIHSGRDAVSARNVAKRRNHLYFSCNAFFFKKENI